MLAKFKNFLSRPTDELGRWSRFFIFQIRMWRQCFRLLEANRAFTQAAALAYHTIFGIVPLAIVMLMVFQMFPAYRDLGDQMRDFAYDYLNLSAMEYPIGVDDSGEPQTIIITAKINEVVEDYLSRVSTGAITIVGVVLVIWAATGMLMTIERTFNRIWHVNVGRSFLQRIVYYSWILVFGPILLALGIFISTNYLIKSDQQVSVQQRTSFEVTWDGDNATHGDNREMIIGEQSDIETGIKASLLKFIRWVFPYIVSMGILFFLYSMMPNTKVNALPALWGAAVATLLWAAIKFGFGLYLSKVVMYQAVYGILGIIPLTVFWIYVMWLIVIFGLQLTYAMQNLKSLDADELSRLRRSGECFLANDQTIIRIMEYILNAFEQRNEQPVTVEAVASRLDIPPDFAERVLNRMVKAGILFHTNEPVSGYVPSTDGTHISLADIYDAVAQVSFAQPLKWESPKAGKVFSQVRELLDKYTLKDVLDPWHKNIPVRTEDRGQQKSEDISV